jgi:hypothetical protein
LFIVGVGFSTRFVLLRDNSVIFYSWREHMSDFASYYASLPEDDLLRITADVANLLPEARKALKAEVEKRNLALATVEWSALPPASQSTSSYSWGKFQGWAMLVCGAFAFLVMLVRGDIFGIIAAPLGAYTGYALIKRKPHGVILFYIGTGIAAVLAIFIDFAAVDGLLASTTESAEKAGYLLGQAIMMTMVTIGWWLIPALAYYRKRQAEFRNNAGSVETPSL